MNPDAEPPEPGTAALTIESPDPGSVHVREVVGSLGALVAPVNLEVTASGAIARIAFETADGAVLGNAGDDMMLPTEFLWDGDVTVTAKAYDTSGMVVATDSVEFRVEAPDAGGCHQWLDLYGIEYTLGPDSEGVDDPVRVTLPLNGVAYRYFWGDRRDTFFMDCPLALSLARAAYHLRARDIVEVWDMGVYNYRCIGNQGTPPNCTIGMSQHAFAKAIDIGGFATGDGMFYSVEDDWVIDPDSERTCEADTEPGKDRFLHEVICDLKADGVWNIVLTPNYNAAHRDHFHVDLTSGADSINLTDGVDIGQDHH